MANLSNNNKTPMVAIVGRPNVGKSTLFNILSRKSASVTADIPGVTRDRVITHANILNKKILLVDTGGFSPENSDTLSSMVMNQVKVAVQEADIVLCLFDASNSPTSIDEDMVDFLRKSGKNTIFVANKCDKKQSELQIGEYYSLGPEEILPVSATHNIGINDLKEKIIQLLPPLKKCEESPEDEEITQNGNYRFKVLFTGRPNAGKSTLINRIVGYERVIVHSSPGTTRDCIEIPVEVQGREIILVDSAGLRRPRSIKNYLEEVVVLRTIKEIEKVNIAVLLVDFREGIVQQDERLINVVMEKGKGLVVGINKWDLAKRMNLNSYMKNLPFKEIFPFVPVVAISGLNGWNIDKLFSAIFTVRNAMLKRIPTARFNRFISQITLMHPHPRVSGKPVKIYFAAQTGINPPEFSFVTNKPEEISENWKRYLITKIRESFGFEGVPLLLRFKPREQKKTKKGEQLK